MYTLKKPATLILAAAAFMSANVLAGDNNYLTARTGAYSLLSSQNEGRRFDKTASDVIGIEYEYRRTNGMSFGGEYLRFSNSYTLGGESAVAYSEFSSANIKQYFQHTEKFYSFLGAGVGIGQIENRGGGSMFYADGVSGPIFQLRGGVTYRMAQLALFAEVRQISAKIVSDVDDSDNIDVSGRGLLGGFAFIF